MAVARQLGLWQAGWADGRFCRLPDPPPHDQRLQDLGMNSLVRQLVTDALPNVPVGVQLAGLQLLQKEDMDLHIKLANQS